MVIDDDQLFNLHAGADHSAPAKKPGRQPAKKAPAKDRSQGSRRKSDPPDSIRNPMPGLDPQQTPGIDRFPEEED